MADCIRGWIELPEAGEPENPGAAQSKNLQASEHEGPRMQPLAAAGGLEVPWTRWCGPHGKVERAGICCPLAVAATKDAPAQESSLCVLLGSLLLLLFFRPGPHLTRWCCLIPGRSTSLPSLLSHLPDFSGSILTHTPRSMLFGSPGASQSSQAEGQ